MFHKLNIKWYPNFFVSFEPSFGGKIILIQIKLVEQVTNKSLLSFKVSFFYKQLCKKVWPGKSFLGNYMNYRHFIFESTYMLYPIQDKHGTFFI